MGILLKVANFGRTTLIVGVSKGFPHAFELLMMLLLMETLTEYTVRARLVRSHSKQGLVLATYNRSDSLVSCLSSRLRARMS